MSVMSLNLIKGFRESHSGHQQLRFTRNYMGANGGPEEDHQLDHCCWTGRVGEREEEERLPLLPQARNFNLIVTTGWFDVWIRCLYSKVNCLFHIPTKINEYKLKPQPFALETHLTPTYHFNHLLATNFHFNHLLATTFHFNHLLATSLNSTSYWSHL